MSKKFFGHPIGLSTLFATELWERFSYYGMRALLVLYLTAAYSGGGYNFSETEALEILAVFVGLVYFTPIIGGILADKIWGQRKSVFIGAYVMAIGHFTLAASAWVGNSDISLREMLLFNGLGILVIGNGFFKPNISSMVGELYDSNDARRDGGFTIFYMGINVGGFLSPLVAGTLGETIGWQWGFLSAGVGMVISTLWFFLKRSTIGKIGLPPNSKPDQWSLSKSDNLQIVAYTILSVLGVVAFIFGWSLLHDVARTIIIIAIALTVFIFLAYTIGSNTKGKDEWSRVAVILILAIFNVTFLAGFEQAPGTLNIFARDNTNRLLYSGSVLWSMGLIAAAFIIFGIIARIKNKQRSGLWLIVGSTIATIGLLLKYFVLTETYFEFPASIFQSANPLFIVLLGPIFSIIWSKLDKSGINPSTPNKFAIGMLLLSLGFWIMIVANQYIETQKLVSPMWLVAVYLLHTMGELCLFPIGLSMITKLSPQKIVSIMMGVWIGSWALGEYLAGYMKSIVTKFNLEVFSFLAVESAIVALIAFAIAPALTKMMKGVK